MFRTKKRYVPITEFTHPILEPLFGDTNYCKNSIDDITHITYTYHLFPFVCYESIFSAFFAKNSIDTKFVFLSTSEAFLKKSDFARNQYVNIIRIRAIESGRYILKCTYDGTSCLINPNGDIVKYINNEFQIVSIPEIKENTIFQKILLKL